VSRVCGGRKLAMLRVVSFLIVAAPLALTGCANVARAPSGAAAKTSAQRSAASKQRVHVVRSGDTLYKIAWQHGIDQRDLARWNGIRDPDVIRVGQRLRLTPPAGTRASPPPPAAATATAPTTSTDAPARSNRGSRRAAAAPPAPPPPPALPPPSWVWPADGAVVSRFGSGEGIATGVGIAGRVGEAVRAAAAGRVVYAGDGLIGYGQLVIVKHDETYLTAYGYNSKLLVTQGQDVARGQTIAEMGTGPERQARLHFEIRRNGTPVDPLQFFPGR
jgi:lipoprotein NlpD